MLLSNDTEASSKTFRDVTFNTSLISAGLMRIMLKINYLLTHFVISCIKPRQSIQTLFKKRRLKRHSNNVCAVSINCYEEREAESRSIALLEATDRNDCKTSHKSLKAVFGIKENKSYPVKPLDGKACSQKYMINSLGVNTLKMS